MAAITPLAPNGNKRIANEYRIMITPFEKEMIVTHMKSRELEYDVDDDGDFRFALSVDGDSDVALAVFLGAEGANGDILSIRCIGMVSIPPDGWMQVMSACNQWNIERRYPKAALVISEIEEPVQDGPTQSGQVHLMAHYPLGAGVTQPLVDDLITETVGGALQFWQWMPNWLDEMATQQAAGNPDIAGPPDTSLN
jgi:Putative bacterial sensory transduction regulator